ncbi:Nif3-like dinuclear metal center hexameric protein [Dyadobacter sp. LHD-138]|uniref:Nif3-like dinuclear metal center hexameric protein n=1 Tax=Dyadobacter sp. LHD-138 TaxID=3071413 RepID=UPI0027E0CDCF|nr:Nif3-like dinuclear metal center hexameric protein [Dyadobacter sp. LHD-138]MDQ6481307.1 Nif3-like dinuclear metal center hexameric protein [Dyadobacter sp. LHD-138]
MDKLLSPFSDSDLKRRKFIENSIKSAGALTLLGLHSSFIKNADLPVKKSFTVQEIIALILKEGNLSVLKDTVDTIKSGRPDQVVTGIVTTMFPTIPVIEQAVKQNANFIIAHEPSFYNHSDNPEWVKNNTVLKEKQALLEKHKIAVWRFHDYCHALKPDAISYGVAKKANWLSYYKTGQVMLTIPQLTFQQLVQHLKSSLGISHVRTIGEPTQPCERIALLPGAWGGQRQVSVAESEKPDVLIVGESPEWETVEYIRDARSFGRKISLIVLGHAVSEEPGMDWVAEWIEPKLTDIKVTHLASGDPFTWV